MSIHEVKHQHHIDLWHILCLVIFVVAVVAVAVEFEQNNVVEVVVDIVHVAVAIENSC